MRVKHFIPILLLLASLDGFSQSEELTISGAIETALENNYGIIISQSDLAVAELNNRWGNAGRYPTVGFSASSNNSYELSDNSSSARLSANLGVNWLLFDGFRVKITKSILENTEDLTSGRLAVTIENTIEDVILAYYQILLEEERLQVFEKIMTLSEDRYNYELQRKALGSAVTYTVLQAENNYLTDKAAFMNQEMVVRNVRRNLNFIMARDLTSGYDLVTSFEGDTTHYDLSELLSKMLQYNQTLKNQYINLQVSKNTIDLRKSAYYPSVSLSTGLSNSYTRTRDANSNPQGFSSYGPYGNLSLSYDFYSGGNRKSDVEIAKISREAQEVNTEQMEHELTNELYNLFDYHEVRIALLEVADKSLEAASLNLELSEEKYRTGVINSFNYRDVQLIYLESSLGRLQAIYNLIVSNTRLTRITGGYLQTEP